MENSNTNPINKIRDAEKEAKKIIQEAEVINKKEISDLIKQKDNELKQRVEETNSKSEVYLRDLDKDIERELNEAQKIIAQKVTALNSGSKEKVARAASLIVQKLVN